MRPPCHYVDFQLGPRPSPIGATLMLKILHGVFAQHPGQYAIGLPDYPRNFPRLRVFSDEREHLDRLVATLDEHGDVGKIGRFMYPKAVPADYAGPWMSYRRFRIPSRKAERNPEGNVRLRRIQAADDAEFPYFALHSKSNGQAWRLYVEAIPSLQPGSFAPDAYGLATASRPFALPLIP